VTEPLPALIELLQRLSGQEGRSHAVIDALWREIDAISAAKLGGTMSKPEPDPISPRYLEQMNDLAKELDARLGKAKFVLLVFEDPPRANYISNCQREDTVQAMREVADRLDPRQ